MTGGSLVRLVLVLLVACLGGAARAGSTAPLTSLYLSPAGSDAAPCTRPRPCASVARGFARARPGQIVVLAPGRYAGQQEVRPSDRAGTLRVVFSPAVPGSVVLESLDVYGSHVEFRGVRIERDFYVKCGAADIVLRGSRAASFFIRTSSNVSLVDSTFGSSDNVSSAIGPGGGDDCTTPPHRVLLDRVMMHDYHSNPFNSVHMECLAMDGATRLTIRNSRFRDCEDFDILVKPAEEAADVHDLVLENNWFGHPAPDGDYAVRFSAPGSGAAYTNVIIRHNSFGGSLNFEPPGEGLDYVNVRVSGNAGGTSPCVDSVAFGYNVWSSGRRCAATERIAPPGFRDVARFDFHLVPGSAAVDRGDRSSFPPRDIDGQRRWAGRAPDAGADEIAPGR